MRGAILNIPPLGVFFAKRKRAQLEGGTALEAIRSVFLGIAGSIWIVLFVLSFVAPFSAPDSFPAYIAIVLAVSLLAGWGVRAVEQRLVGARTNSQLADAYRGTFFIQLGLSEFAALFSFVLSFIGSTVWIYAVGAVLASINLWRMAPTRRNIRRIQDGLHQAGVPASLSRALTSRGESAGA